MIPMTNVAMTMVTSRAVRFDVSLGHKRLMAVGKCEEVNTSTIHQFYS